MEIEWEEFHCLEKMTYDDALEYVKTVSEDGWRIPSSIELIEACKNYIEGFQRWGYWSSDIYKDDYCGVVYFYTANLWKMEKDSKMYVRFIRKIE